MSNYTALKNINDFESLVEYLREELDWEFESEDSDDLTFDYEAEELGLDEATSAKITSIRQLRPFVSNQPWGIFYIDFEPKKLPVVALRRILGKLAVKRRASSNQAERATWRQHDLLFISSCGENDGRTMTFAHFSDNSGFGDLPTLKTFGWNNLDTISHLQHAHRNLDEKLRFPDDPSNTEEWRKGWSSAFTHVHGVVIRTSKQLALQLAKLADNIRTRANEVLLIETEKGALRKLYKAFQEALIHDLSYDDFADMYAQTISYGLLTAKISRPAGLVADNIADMIPVTNPFLKELLQTFLVVGGRGNLIDFDELGINDVVEMLRGADMDAVLRDFGDRNPHEDPAIHFYELFLKEYDPEKRMKRGVFYTPRPVVSFIVRSVHEILQKEFGLVDGLADTTTWGEMKARNKDLEVPKGVKEASAFVQILDPATGTGTFLVEVINVIYKTMVQKWKREGKSETQQVEAWNDYVPRNLLPRLYGFELMMAPYSIAHMKIGLVLKETGYRFLSSERAQIYLTNTLEEPKEFSDYFATMSPALAHEAEKANIVKRQTAITVVVGNPPYSRVSLNQGEFILRLMETYKKPVADELNQQPLNDDYIKFLRLVQHLQKKMPYAVIGMITNHTFLSGILFRGVRQMLAEDYKQGYFVDLHGNSNIQERGPNGSKDENVFDISAGVSITFLIRAQASESVYQHKDAWGSRESKYSFLNTSNIYSIKSEFLYPTAKYYFLTPKDFALQPEYDCFQPVNKIFPLFSSGLMTVRDNLAIAYDGEELRGRFQMFRSSELSDNEFQELIPVKDYRNWSLSKARENVRVDKTWSKNIQIVNYRPFDKRYIFYSSNIVTYPNYRVMNQFLSPNLGLITSRINKGEKHAHEFVTKEMTEIIFLSSKSSNNAFVFPLYVYPTEREKAFGATNRVPNLSDRFIKEFSNKLGLEFVYDTERSQAAFMPEDVFAYVYAILHSPTYRARYAEFLKIDFPGLPLTTDTNLFRKLCALGTELVALHLLEGVDAPPDWNLITAGSSLFQNKTVATGFPKKDLAEIDESGKGEVYINKTTYFDGVPEPVWNFHIGGYRVCHKWLKDRKDRELSSEDIAHYGKIVVALSETIRLMAEIDAVIEKHGGFPLVGSQI